MANWFTRKEVTYHRDVGKERKALIREAKKQARIKKRQEAKEYREGLRAEAKERKAREKLTKRSLPKDIDSEAWFKAIRGMQENPKRVRSKLNKGVRGLVRLEGRGRSSRLVIYT